MPKLTQLGLTPRPAQLNLVSLSLFPHFFQITEARLENGPSGPFKLYCSGKVDLMKSESGPGRREGCVWARQDPHPQLTAQHPPTEIQRHQGTRPGLQSIRHRLLPLPRGPAGKLLQLYWDDEGSLDDERAGEEMSKCTMGDLTYSAWRREAKKGQFSSFQ